MGMKTFIRVGGFLVLGGLGLAGLTGCSAAHTEVCVSDTYPACRCGGGLIGRMARVDGAFIPCQCPESCVGAVVGLFTDCTCVADTGFGTESQRGRLRLTLRVRAHRAELRPRAARALSVCVWRARLRDVCRRGGV